MNSPAYIDTLRDQLMATLADLRSKTDPMDPARAMAVARVAAVLVDTARVEVDFLKATSRDQSNFFGATSSGTSATTHGLPNGISSVVRHQLKG